MALVQQNYSSDDPISPLNMTHYSSFLPLRLVFLIANDWHDFSNVRYWTGLPVDSMALQQTVFVFVLPSFPRMLFGFLQSLVKFAHFVSVFFCLLYLVCVLPPHQLIRVKTCSFPPSLSRYVKGWLFICLFMSTITISSCSKLRVQGAKKIIFTACHSGKLKPAFTSPDIISTSPKNLLFFCYSNSS